MRGTIHKIDGQWAVRHSDDWSGVLYHRVRSQEEARFEKNPEEWIGKEVDFELLFHSSEGWYTNLAKIISLPASKSLSDQEIEAKALAYAQTHADVSDRLGFHLVKSIFSDGAGWARETICPSES